MSAPRDLDLDRDLELRLGAFLDEGPNRATEGAIDLALAHARTHPRRRDPLRAIRRDPMARPWFGQTPVARSLVLVAALAALLVASIAIASVGGLLTRPVVVPPAPSATPTATPDPSTGPSGSPVTRRIDLVERLGADALIEVTDESFTLADAVSGTPADGGSVPGGSVSVAGVPGDPKSVQLTWTVGSCETLHQLLISPGGRTMTLFQPTCEGDATPRDLVLVLTFAGPVDPASIAVTLSLGG